MKLKKIGSISLSIVILGLLFSYVPMTQQRVLSVGTDSFESHHALYGPRVKSQKVSLQAPLTEVGVILVNLRHTENLPSVEVAIYSPDNVFLEKQIISSDKYRDDEFAWAAFSQIPDNARELRVDFSAPQASYNTAVGLRFDTDGDGHIALAVREQVPLWWRVHHFITTNARGQMIVGALAATLLVTIIIALPNLFPRSPRLHAKIYLSFLLSLFLLTILIRFNTLSQLKGVSGGDAYNYFSITRQITSLKDPFAVDKRLPGWPLLMVPAFVTDIDDIQWMRTLSILSAGGTVVVLSLLARSLKLPWSVQVLAPVLLAFQKDFYLTSLRPEPYTFYTLLLVTALLLFQHLEKKWVQIAFGVVLGYAAMTRQEGFVLAVVLGLCTLPFWKKLWWQGYVRIGIPAFLLVVPFFLHNTIAFGNPLYTQYFEGERNQIVDSGSAFQESLGATWGVVGALWRTVWEQQFRVSLTKPLFLAGIVFVLMWWIPTERVRNTLLRRSYVSWGIAGIGATVLCMTLWIVLHRFGQFGSEFMMVSAGMLLASIVPFLAWTKWRGLPIVLVLLSQTMIALWFHPFPKHYQQSYPLFILLLACALLIPFYRLQERRLVDEVEKYHWGELLSGSIYIFAVLVPFAITIGILIQKMNPVIDLSNEQTAADYVIYRAVKTAEKFSSPYGFDREYQQPNIFFPDKANYYPSDASLEQQQWITQQRIATMVVTNVGPKKITPEETWREVAHFKSEGKNERLLESWVYEIP